jgi:riboflavin biosynthesis pyrimidine reductase
MEHLSTQVKRRQIEWRRAKVLELSSQGHSQREIADTIHVGIGTINRDMAYLRLKTHSSRESQNSHPRQTSRRISKVYDRNKPGVENMLEIVNKSRIANNDNNGQTVTITDNKTVLQVLALINDCNKYKMDLTTNGVVISDAIKFVQTNKEKLTMSTKEEDNGSKEGKEPDYDEDQDQLEEKQEETDLDKTKTVNQVF